jgi:rhodanese-related sulfurtransferase
MNRNLPAFAACVVVCVLSGPGQAADHTKDTPEAVKKAIASGKAVLLDVREPDEWDEGHLKDAKLLPLSRIKAGVPAAELKQIAPAGSVVYAHCRSGGRCLTAAALLKKEGYDVRALKLGYEDLLKAGFPKAAKK